jgi:large subunit ribosomal protein L31
MACGGTKESYIVDVWSGNHPFYQGAKNTIVMDDGRVSRFNKQFKGLSDTMGNVETANGPADANAPVKVGPKQARAPKAKK